MQQTLMLANCICSVGCGGGGGGGHFVSQTDLVFCHMTETLYHMFITSLSLSVKNELKKMNDVKISY